MKWKPLIGELPTGHEIFLEDLSFRQSSSRRLTVPTAALIRVSVYLTDAFASQGFTEAIAA